LRQRKNVYYQNAELKDVLTLPDELEEFVIHMAQRGRDAVTKDAPTLSNREVCVPHMEQRGHDVALRDVPM
jgi:hypothetical protein